MTILAAFLLVTTGAIAEEPSSDAKQWALQRAYVINDGKMVRWDSIDVSEKPLDPRVVEWAEKNMLDTAADVPYLRTKGDGICYRHGMHKVTSRDGRSWRCRR